jgi:hypothetical protein
MTIFGIKVRLTLSRRIFFYIIDRHLAFYQYLLRNAIYLDHETEVVNVVQGINRCSL